MNEMPKPSTLAIKGEDHGITKDGGVKLFLFEKYAGDALVRLGYPLSADLQREEKAPALINAVAEPMAALSAIAEPSGRR